jgi:A/G-specific adenine glycosylase
MAQCSLASAASRWYATNARDLPWRQPDVTAWGVLVSEVMLQQTPVSRVLPVWQEWLARWPDPAALAEEAPAAAIRMWGRLGYPRRALRLHECACELVHRFHGRVPADLGDLLALPGIGQYTARAVAVFAYGHRHPVVDTNVRRLVARAVSGRADAGPATTPRDLRAVTQLLPERPVAAARASVAFMELGALVCTVRAPRCRQCPLRTHCAWVRAGSPAATGPARRRQAYAGTDRQVRGLLMAELRAADGPVAGTRLDTAWPDAAQRARALSGLIEDGLVDVISPERFALPGKRRRRLPSYG